MAVISNLDVNLNARTQKFDRNIKKSGGVFGRFSSRIGGFSAAKFAGGMAIVGGAVATFAGLARTLTKVNEQFDKIDKISKLADKVGAATSEIQALNLQATLTGASQETMAKGVERFTRILGDARNGNTAAIGSFEKLGLTASQFDGLSLTQQLGLVSDSINNGATAADRASLAYGVFGRQGADLMTFFASGSAGIQAATDDIESFGGALTRVDGAQIEMANDAWARMEALMDVIYQNIAVQVAPIMTALVETFTDGAKEFGGLSGVIETGFSILTAGIGFTIDAWNVLDGAVNLWRGTLVATIAQALRGLEAIEKGLNYISGGNVDFGIKGLADEIQKEADQFLSRGVEKALDGFNGKGSQAFQARLDEIKNRAEEIADAVSTPPPPPPKPPGVTFAQLLDRGAIFAGSLLDSISSGLASFKLPDAPEQRQSVSAAAFGSGQAQSIINQLGSRDNQLALQKAQVKKQDESNRLLSTATGYLSKLVSKEPNLVNI